MTRQEFIYNITSWRLLKDFCYDNECNECDNIYDEYERDVHIDNRLIQMATQAESWQDLLNDLNDVTTGYEYYEMQDDVWGGLTQDDFDRYKGYVMDWMDDNDYWDEEDEDEISDEEPVVEEPIPVGELFTLCNNQLQTINGRTNK